MTLKTIFEKQVDRPIEGVIKADDQASLKNEIEEYVLTKEIKKRLESFFYAYNNYQGANGVWVSGFFGSGKSHLLKILALLLENREIEDQTVLDIMLPKFHDDSILKAELTKAVKIPSKSILFNIDQKADVVNKQQLDALLSVFVKVFDESCGYYGKQAYIAQFERDLDHDGLLEKFKEEFKSLSSYEWEWGRMRAKRVASYVDKAYSSVTGEEVSEILDKYRIDYRLSIEDFADQVNQYIESKGKDFRLNFFVDEVGQYVADNVKLMTNLQTIAESLATKSRGRAWIIVTAQEDMNSVVGEFNKQQGNDFSKIQARFANRMKLTSADVEEVIQKRLLYKNEKGIKTLSKVYDEQVNNFKTLFDFTDGSQLYKNFKDQNHFIHTYPFVPYQFILFQTAIQNLSVHNAFEGKHSSVGERSMLGVFQQVVINISHQEIGKLATFDLMFEGIRSALKAHIQRAVQLAEKNLDNEFAVKVLKALFLVKYIREFKATKRNLSVLMLDEFNKNMNELNKELTSALELLELQTYIQRNGDLYEFLTDDEKDVEENIKNTEIESSAIEAHLNSIIFDGIIGQKKIRYESGKHDYPFSKKIDNNIFGREHELSIRIITPFNANPANEETHKMHSYDKDELLIIMPYDKRIVDDLHMYEKTKKYAQQNISSANQGAIKRILNDKLSQNNERYEDIKFQVKKYLSEAKLFINSNLLDIPEKEASERIVQGFNELIKITYPDLKMLPDFHYSEKYISECLKNKGGGFHGDLSSMGEPEHEILSFVKANKRNGLRTTIKSIVERFEKKSYGWYYAAILCTLAKLCASEKADLVANGNILSADELEKAISNSHGHSNIIVEPVNDFTAGQIRKLKDFYEDFFDKPVSGTEAKIIGSETADSFASEAEELFKLASASKDYPFLEEIENAA
ncbi:MAG: BREX system P-loop protein BrxC, partial [Candidatus Muiribacteriota bacterium]